MGSLYLLGFQGFRGTERRQTMVTGDWVAISAINAVDPYEDEIELTDYLKVLWKISHKLSWFSCEPN